MTRKQKTQDDVIEIAKSLRTSWKRAFIIWTVVTISLPILSVLSSITAVLIVYYFHVGPLYPFAFSLFSIMATIVEVVLTVKQYPQRYRSAYYQLNKALTEYFFQPNEETKKKVVEAIDKGEKIINGTYDVFDN